MALKDIKKELRKFDKDKLVDLITDLYKKNKSVKDFFDFYISPDEKKLFDKYSIKVIEAFYSKNGFDYNLGDGKKAISEFKKYGISSDLLADLMLLYVETGVKFTVDFGDIDERFYISIEKMFEQALTLMRKDNILDKFTKRAYNVVLNAHDTGWGFHDALADIFWNFNPDYDEDHDFEPRQKNDQVRIINLFKK